jgi:hypothetical protein
VKALHCIPELCRLDNENTLEIVKLIGDMLHPDDENRAKLAVSIIDSYSMTIGCDLLVHFGIGAIKYLLDPICLPFKERVKIIYRSLRSNVFDDQILRYDAEYYCELAILIVYNTKDTDIWDKFKGNVCNTLIDCYICIRLLHSLPVDDATIYMRKTVAHHITSLKIDSENISKFHEWIMNQKEDMVEFIMEYVDELDLDLVDSIVECANESTFGKPDNTELAFGKLAIILKKCYQINKV